jgi:hypothetical protein
MAWQVCPHGIEELIKVAFDLQATSPSRRRTPTTTAFCSLSPVLAGEQIAR